MWPEENGDDLISTTNGTQAFLRSINVGYDACHPERIAHYQPTAKSVALLHALLGRGEDRAFLIVAPYGSGKSITATYLLQLVENRVDASEILQALSKKLAHVDPDLGQFAEARWQKPQRTGLVLTLHGYAYSLAESLKTAVLEAMARVKLGRQSRSIQHMPCDDIEQALALLTAAQEKACAAGCDQFVILWDEFGRHLEWLLAEGRSSALLDIQILAEFVSRSQLCPMTFGLLLHQGLLQYAGQTPQSVRTEWTKIEGRFRTIQYVDDSKELYHLIGDIVSSQTILERPSTEAVAVVAAACHGLGLFTAFTTHELEALLTRAYPLTPVTLYLLPRLASRMAQNERTLFSFLYHIDLSVLIRPTALFDDFAPIMRTDTSVGGTYRQWLETQSALAKVGDDHESADVLKTTCLLGLGASGERAKVSRDLLRFALHEYAPSSENTTVIDSLIEYKLLLYRQHNDEVSVWHGTDVDLRGRLEVVKQQQKDHFELSEFLRLEAAPPVWRPTAYNDEFCLRRYLPGEYLSLDMLEASRYTAGLPEGLLVHYDGKVQYILAQSSDELHDVEEIVRRWPCQSVDKRVVFALPQEPLPLYDAALEVASLLQMQLDTELIGSDPLVLPELQQMTDDAREHLQRLIKRLVHPAPRGPRWFYSGSEFQARTSRDLRHALSHVMRQVYPDTPKINNEMIVRQKPAPVIVNARKKLLFSILERSGQSDLGIEGQGPEVSIYRTALLNTGLYHQQGGRWCYASPEEIQEPGLRAVWQLLQQFLTEPAALPKSFCSFFDTLMAPPFGVRAGLFPILFTAALQAFPSARSLMKAGEYVTDILPSVIEELCREPEKYRLLVLDIDTAKQSYLREFYTCFSAESTSHVSLSDLIRACFDALESWKAQLPPAALATQQLSESTLRFQAALRRQTNPVPLLFNAIPDACGYSIEQVEPLLGAITRCKDELMSVAVAYRERAAAAVRRTFAFDRHGSDQDVREIARRWAHCFSMDFAQALPDRMEKGVLSRVCLPYDSDDALLESLASLLVGKVISRWDDSTVAVFDRELQSVVRRIEEAVLTTDINLPERSIAAQGLAALIQGRMATLYHRLAALVNEDAAEEVLLSLASSTDPTHTIEDEPWRPSATR